MTNNIFMFINSFFDLAVYFIFMSALLNFKKLNIKKALYYIIFVLLQLLCCFVPCISGHEFQVFIIQTLSLLIPSFFYFRTSLKKLLINTALTYCLIFVIQFTFAFFVALIWPDAKGNMLIISACIYTILIAVIITRFVNFDKIYNALFTSKKIGYIILINIVMMALVTSFYIKIHNSSFINLAIYFFFAIALIIIVNVLLINQSFTISKQGEQLRAYNEYMPVLNELILSVRARQHNHINEIQAIFGLMYTHKDYDSLVDAMTDTLDEAIENKEPDYLLKLNLLLVSGFLFQKQRYALSQGKNIIFHFNTYELHTDIPEYELIKLFGILIDNALEAIPADECIFVNVNSTGNKIEFQTRNPGWILSSDDLNNFFKNGYSKKPDYCTTKNHTGLGLYYLRDVIFKKYSGKIILWNEGTDILFKIII